MNTTNNQSIIPEIPIRLDINLDAQQSIILSFTLFIALLAALLVFGFVFKK